MATQGLPDGGITAGYRAGSLVPGAPSGWTFRMANGPAGALVFLDPFRKGCRICLWEEGRTLPRVSSSAGKGQELEGEREHVSLEVHVRERGGGGNVRTREFTCTGA